MSYVRTMEQVLAADLSDCGKRPVPCIPQVAARSYDHQDPASGRAHSFGSTHMVYAYLGIRESLLESGYPESFLVRARIALGSHNEAQDRLVGPLEFRHEDRSRNCQAFHRNRTLRQFRG